MSVHDHLFTVTAVHDGDTLEGNLDLDFYVGLSDVSLRIYGINAPELTVLTGGHRVLQQSGEDATQHLLGLLGGADLFAPIRTRPVFGIPGNYLIKQPGSVQLVVRTRLNTGDGDWDKYGRVLGQCFLATNPLVEPYGLDIGAQMLADGQAVVDLPDSGDVPA